MVFFFNSDIFIADKILLRISSFKRFVIYSIAHVCVLSPNKIIIFEQKMYETYFNILYITFNNTEYIKDNLLNNAHSLIMRKIFARDSVVISKDTMNDYQITGKL